MNLFTKNILTMLMLFQFVYVKTEAQTNFCNNNKYNFSQFAEETVDFLKTPSKWNYKDAIKLGTILGSTIILMNFDDDIKTFALKNNRYAKSFLPELGKYWGEPLTTLLFATTFGLHGIVTKNNTNKQLAFEIIQAGFYASIITGTLKYSFGRARPYTKADAFTFEPFSFRGNDYLSFSSGHTALAFSLSTILSSNIDNNYLKTIAFIPAVLTAISRVYQNFHWSSDVFFGACIGYFVGRFVHNLHKKELPNSRTFIHSPTISVSVPF